ncbi:hypothetical protein CRG98_016911 [Punica granatum]|uniref:Reverse transcriptase Ty1/copia-type domain-containing protein n=1 Tax=Punica granatum TaxID=22663 RepID=A0A2I0K3C1_PUNGR|nr:hypothetical protein CRG98_016911 [Punica granatum]
MGNGQSCKIVGTGDVCLETELGCKLLLKKVRHVPEIRLNLISTGQLDDEGYSNEFSNGRWKLSKGSLIVARGQKTDTLYRLRARHNSGQINVVEDYPIELWHRRHGHISEKGIQILARKQSLPVKGMHLSTCDHCSAVAHDGDVPQQVWTEKKVSYKHLRVFGCRASVHIPRDERSKLDAKAKQCIFLGYAHEEFGYRFWDPDSKKIIRSRDVVFFEDQTIEDLQKLEKARVGNPHEISIPIPVDVEHLVEEVPGEYEETTTGGEIHQKKRVDFEEIFSPVVKMSSIRVILALTAILNLEIEQLDVKTAFLHGDLEEEIYMEQPEGFQVKGKEHLVCKLRKSLYGLKQAPRQWYKKFDSFMLSLTLSC